MSALYYGKKGLSMRFIVLVSALVVSALNAAQAQQSEQQVFYPYAQPAYLSEAPQTAAQQQAPTNPNRYMVYPGREQYGQDYGYIPRHPGDYRDAVDRGQWEGGGGASMPRRSFSGY